MKIYQTDQIRNIVLVGNSGSGKTTLAESMLFEGGVISRRGDIESKNTVSDYNDIEQTNSCSIFPSILYTECQDKKINMLDTPGSDDFIGGVVAALRVVDSALMVINTQNGVEVGTQIVSRYTDKYNKPVVFAFNHLDHDKSNFEKSLEAVRQFFGNKTVLVQYPVQTGTGFHEIIDLLKMKLLKYTAEGGKPEIVDIPGDQKDHAADLRNQMIELAAENEESLMEKFFETGTLSEEDILKGLSLGIKSRNLQPIFCVSAKKNIGVQRLMELLAILLPGPADVAVPVDIDNKDIPCVATGPASLFVFRSVVETHIGEINYFKVMSGKITEGIDLINNNNQGKERLSQLFVVAGKTRTKVSEMIAGDIGATVKLKNTKTNHTLASPGKSIEFAPIEFPEPRFRTAIRAKSESDDEKLGETLQRIHTEDPTIVIEYSKELKQILIHGQGEHHLNIMKWHLDNIYKIDTEFLPPRIPYRETITKIAQSTYRHKKQSGGAGQFGEVHMVIEPFVEGMPDPKKYNVEGKEINISVRGKDEHVLPWGGKLVYYNCIVGGSIDARFMPAILKGIMEKMEEGPLTGSYARDIRVSVYDGKMHPVDSNEISFRLAGRNAFKEAFKNAGPKIMEPIYNVEVLLPADKMGDVMSDLQGRRAIVQGMSHERGFEVIIAKVPLAEMNKYSTALSSITSGRAMYTMKFSEYAQVPGEIQNNLLKAYEAQQDEE
jgi:elongation factor G